MIEALTEEELLFCETLYDPVAFAETMFIDLDNLSAYDEEHFSHIRLGQLTLLSYEYLIDHDNNKTVKQNFRLLEGAGNCWVMAARNFGKTLTTRVDVLESIVLHENFPMIVTSYDYLHIRGMMEPILNALDDHPIISSFKASYKRSPSYYIITRNNNIVESVNMNILSRDPGSHFFQKHAKKIWLEENCVDGSTKVKMITDKGEIKSKHISYIINRNLWKRWKILSYNIKDKKIEAKKITKVFKKRVKDYVYYKIIVDSVIGKAKRTLKVSQKQKIWCNNKYLLPEEIKKGDNLYLLDSPELERRQKEILLGCLLGDSSLGKKTRRLVFSQGKNQLSYLNYKKEIFSSLFNSFRRTPVNKEFNKVRATKKVFINDKEYEKRNNKYILGKVKVVKIEKVKVKSWVMYDLEVEDNHNFFGNGLLISNSFESEKVYKKRIDSKHELGWIERAVGMTNFTRHTPAGKIFYNEKLKPRVINYPQYVNPFWDEEEKKKAIEKYKGEQSIGYRIFVEGQVVEEGVSFFDMDRIRPFYNQKRSLKKIEIDKKTFRQYKQLLIVERPKGIDQIYIAADIGTTAPTEIAILSKKGKNYKYLYNVTVRRLTDKEQVEVFSYLIEKLSANLIGLDCTGDLGRVIYRQLTEKYGKEHIVWVDLREKIPVDFLRNDRNEVIYRGGQPEYVEEYVINWSVQRLQELLYDHRINVPCDAYKFDEQINSVFEIQGTNRIIYQCTASDGDHLYQAFQIFAIMDWMNEFNLIKPIVAKKHCKTGV